MSATDEELPTAAKIMEDISVLELAHIAERHAMQQAEDEGRDVVACSSEVTIDAEGRATCYVLLQLAPEPLDVTVTVE